jgi:glycosyltransferase involved in cell wall biosynthesis
VIDAVHQFVATLEPGAVGAHTLEVQRLLRGLGLASDIYAEHSHPGFADGVLPFPDYGPIEHRRAGEALLYQMAIGSWVGNYVNGRQEPLLVNYHNVTPSHFYSVWDVALAEALDWGRRQLVNFGARGASGLAPSAYSRSELLAAGFAEAVVAPLLLDPAALAHDADGARLAELRRAKEGGGSDWLFVGRVAPHKAQHDIVRAFALSVRLYDRRARLHLVGGPASGAYPDALRRLAADLGVGDRVFLTGPLSDAGLAAHYETADVFVCLSDHEGFCVPLLEAMHHGVPIVALAAAAVPETLGDAGLALRDKAAATVAAAVHRVTSDPSLGAQLAAAGHARLGDFSLARSRQSFTMAVEAMLAAL